MKMSKRLVAEQVKSDGHLVVLSTARSYGIVLGEERLDSLGKKVEAAEGETLPRCQKIRQKEATPIKLKVERVRGYTRERVVRISMAKGKSGVSGDYLWTGQSLRGMQLTDNKFTHENLCDVQRSLVRYFPR